MLIGKGQNQVPANCMLGNMAYINKEDLTLRLKPSVSPNGIGEMVFELTSNTSLTIKVKGTDGIVRSASLTLA